MNIGGIQELDNNTKQVRRKHKNRRGFNSKHNYTVRKKLYVYMYVVIVIMNEQ